MWENMIIFEIAGVLLGVVCNSLEVNSLIPFYTCRRKRSDIKIYINRKALIPTPPSEVIVDDPIKWYRNSEKERGITLCVYKQDANEVDCMLRVNKSWRKAYLTCLGEEPAGSIIGGPLGEILFRNKILFHDGMVFHAAAIEWNGKGIIFTAPTGAGKTTQAELWKKYRGAVVLNGDRSAVRLIDNQPFVYGTPWSGTSPEYRNQKAPLHAIVLLEQAEENQIRQLNQNEALSRLLPRGIFPNYDEEKSMRRALRNLNRIIRVTPVFLLRCRADREAVELVYECIK
jgi:hypothetical protein